MDLKNFFTLACKEILYISDWELVVDYEDEDNDFHCDFMAGETPINISVEMHDNDLYSIETRAYGIIETVVFRENNSYKDVAKHVVTSVKASFKNELRNSVLAS